MFLRVAIEELRIRLASDEERYQVKQRLLFCQQMHA